MTTLIYASKNGHLETAKLLIANGADVNNRGEDEDKFTPLIYASKNGHPEVVKLLINKGADVNARDERG